jgi:purine-binding chemotaxis protein CheW
MNLENSVEQILRQRAVRLALPPAAESPAEEQLELLEFRLGSERYAVETRHASELHPLRDLTPLPGTPAFVRGIVNLRGRILAVYDLRRFFGMPEQGITDLHRILVVEGEDFEVGLLADRVIGVCTLPRAALSPPPPTLTAIAADYLKGICDDRLIVLDLERLLADPRMLVNDGDNE